MFNTVQNTGYQQNFGALKPNAIKLLSEAAGKDTGLMKELQQLSKRASQNKLVHVDIQASEDYYNMAYSNLYKGPNQDERILRTTDWESKSKIFDLAKKQIERAETEEKVLNGQIINRVI